MEIHEQITSSKVDNPAFGDMVPIKGDEVVFIHGFDQMFRTANTKALVLAGTVLFCYDNKQFPTKEELLIIVQMAQRKLKAKNPKIKVLGNNSSTSIMNHIKSLEAAGYLSKIQHGLGTEIKSIKEKRKQGRGSANRPYWPNCIKLVLNEE